MSSSTASQSIPLNEPVANTPLKFSALHVRLVLVALGLLCLALSQLLRWLRPDHADVFSLWAMLGLALASVPVLIDSLTSLKADGFEATKYYMDQFVALAILACFATAQYATGTIVAAILIVGQMLEEHTTLGVEEAVKSLLKLSRVKTRRISAENGDSEELVDAADLRPGDKVRLRPGDAVPADGEILTGFTTLHQASITGESMPVDGNPGSPVYAGTINLTGVVTVIVRRTGEDTAIGRVRLTVEEARASRAPLMRLIDTYTQYYMPFVLITAGFVLFFTHEISRAISVIIVAMPCAFVLASPTAMVAALAVASRMGVLVKSSRSFEVAAGIDSVVFDKTGTLTTGQLRVTAIRPQPGATAEELLMVAASLEEHSTHPIARAVLWEARLRGVFWQPLYSTVVEVAGRGMRSGGLVAGRRQLLETLGIQVPVLSEDADTSTLHVARDGHFIGVIVFADQLREESGDAVASLRAVGVDNFVMLTGDRSGVARDIAQRAGLDRFRADCLPDEKLQEVEALKLAGHRVMVVGDGVNDALALAVGDLSVAMGALGSDVAIHTADVALMGNDLRNLPRFLKLSDRTLRVINQNLLCGFVFIAAFIALSAAGIISPIVAACLHEFSAFFVIFNSARILRFDELADV